MCVCVRMRACVCVCEKACLLVMLHNVGPFQTFSMCCPSLQMSLFINYIYLILCGIVYGIVLYSMVWCCKVWYIMQRCIVTENYFTTVLKYNKKNAVSLFEYDYFFLLLPLLLHYRIFDEFNTFTLINSCAESLLVTIIQMF